MARATQAPTEQAPEYEFLSGKPDDAWEVAARDRARCPVAYNPLIDAYQVSSYDAVEQVLRDWHTFSSRGTVDSHQEEILAFTDPPRHTRQRRLFATALSPRRMEEALPQIQARADDIIDALGGRDRFDIIEEFANPLVLGVICDLLGVPSEDIPRFRSWTKAAERNSYRPDPARTEELREFRRYSYELIAARRADASPPDDLVTGLLHAEWEDDRLDEREVANILEFLLVSANSTTTDAIGSLVWALETHPAEKAKLLSDPERLLPSAVEELLRFEGPIHALQRTTVEDTELGGCPIPAGARLLNLYGAASRDAKAFDEADRFKVDRDWSKLPHHFGFGWGIHFCLGAHLARTEISVAIRTLYDRLPGVRIVPGFVPSQVDAPFLRGWQEVLVEFDAPTRPRRAAA
jgi:cytochrome P450